MCFALLTICLGLISWLARRYEFYSVWIQTISREVRRWVFRVPVGYDYSVSCCPGPGGSWGNPAVPPPSTEGESPINLFHSISGGGGGCYFILRM